MKDLLEEACCQKQLCGNTDGVDCIELKKIVLQRYVILPEEPGFERVVMLMASETMKDLVATTIVTNCI